MRVGSRADRVGRAISWAEGPVSTVREAAAAMTKTVVSILERPVYGVAEAAGLCSDCDPIGPGRGSTATNDRAFDTGR
jgi:hypothetical protein